MKNVKKMKRLANTIERQRLALALKFLKAENYIVSNTAFIAKYKLRSNYIADLNRVNCNMYIADVVTIVYSDYPIIRKEWLVNGTGRMLNIQYRNLQAIENNDMYERWETMARELHKNSEEQIIAELKKDNPLFGVPSIVETTQTINTQNINSIIEYLMGQLHEKDTIIAELKNEIEQLKKAVEN